MYMHTTVSVYSATRLKKRFENGQHARWLLRYRATALIRMHLRLGPYSRALPRALSLMCPGLAVVRGGVVFL